MKILSDKIAEYLKTIETSYGIPKHKVIIGSSLCSDELNHDTGFLSQPGSVFYLGGLAGYPYAGITGINAMLDHVADNGAAVILYGPHIGRDETGEYGLFKRPYQDRKTLTCGALCHLLNNFPGDEQKGNSNTDQYNIEINFLRDRLYQQKNLFRDNSIKQLTYGLFEIINSDLLHMLEKSNLTKYTFPVFIIGGIIIHTNEKNLFDVQRSGRLNTSPDYKLIIEDI